nr:hypothetical protein [Tanacetum cinerariifolium]
MIAILEKYEHNTDFHQIVDFVEASHLRYALTINPTVYVSHIRQFWSTARIETTDEGTKILATVDGTPTEPHHTPSPEAQQTLPTATSSPLILLVTTKPLPTVIPTDTPQLRQYTRRARIAQSKALLTAVDELISPMGDDIQGEAYATVSGLEAEHDRANITKTSTLPSDSTPRVTSLAADEGSMQQKLNELTNLCTRLQRKQDEMASKITAQYLEIATLKARIKHLKDRDRGDDDPSGEDATIKGRRLESGEEASIERNLLKHFDREDLNQLWALVKETLNIRQATNDKEKELWVELKRLYEPDIKGLLWTHTQNMMHAPVEWKLYDTCGVHHASSPGIPTASDEFPLPEEVPIASEEKFPLLKKKDATGDKDCAANEDKG